MDKREVKERIDKIRRAVKERDNETAHGLEDALWGDVLVAISEGADNPKELAKECLKTLKIVYARWYG
jgi:hypothetical protein